MKSTSAAQIEKKLAKLVDSKVVNKTSIIYGWVKEIIGGNKVFRPVYSQGSSWKHSSLFDRTFEFTNILKMLDIEYTLTNDSPRGGKIGALLTITTKIK